MKSKYILAAVFIAVIIAFAILVIIASAIPVFADGGNWSEPAVWCGDPEDSEAAALAARFKASAENMMMSVPIYDIRVDYDPKGANIFPITINREDVLKGRPANIIWIGRYNGFNEEKMSSFAGNERVINTRFTCTTSASGNKFYALEGVVTWTPKTERKQDKICVVWDSMARTRVYLGISFPDLLESVGITGSIDGYASTDNHDYIYDREMDELKEEKK